jgi:hypothetical protein
MDFPNPPYVDDGDTAVRNLHGRPTIRMQVLSIGRAAKHIKNCGHHLLGLVELDIVAAIVHRDQPAVR